MSFFCRCFDIFSPTEQKILKKYREENFAPKKLVYDERRAIGKCPLTPEEVMLLFQYIFLECSYYYRKSCNEKISLMRFMNVFQIRFAMTMC